MYNIEFNVEKEVSGIYTISSGKINREGLNWLMSFLAEV